MNSCIKKVYGELEKQNLDGLILSCPANISYLSNTRSRDSYLIISKKKNIYITDSRYFAEVKKNLKSCDLKKSNSSVFKTIADSCKELRLDRVGFEERYLPFAEYQKIRQDLDYAIELIPTHSITEEFRQIKTPEELIKLRKAVSITIKAFKFIQDFLVPGRKESEVAAELQRFIRYNGASAASFEIIVASGPNSSLPHHLTSERKIKNNQPVLIDLGVDYLGYKSNLTRVFFLGKINIFEKRIYNTVLKAQERAIRKIRPDVLSNKIDAASRQYISQCGYGGFFGHNLGHGVGLEVHEEPQISAQDDNRLKAGMVFTIEPAIYLPQRFGIRIEDICLVTKQGVEVISGALHK